MKGILWRLWVAATLLASISCSFGLFLPTYAATEGASGSGLTYEAGRGQCRVLAVGVGDYEHEDINDLPFAVADVKEVAQALVQFLGVPASNVILMTSDDPPNSLNRPTHVNVIKRLDFLAQEVRPEDTLIFIFSGHGYQREGGRHFLAMVNTDPATIETLQMTALPLELLQEKLHKIRARQIVLILDACRNDPEKGRAEGDNPLSEDFAKSVRAVAKVAGAGLGGSAVMFACSLGERAYDWPEKGHGVFSWFISKGLRGEAADVNNEITMSGLGDYVQRQVVQWAKERLKKQTPDLHQQGAARIVLGHTAHSTISVPTLGQTWVNPADGMEFVFVPAGTFIMGSDSGFASEKPAHTVTLPAYWIGKYEVTVGQFRRFVEESGYKPQGPWEQSGSENHLPVAYVTWHDAVAYCQWAGVRLPTEAEWEKAARGTDARRYPWGNEWDPKKANTFLSGPKRATPIGQFPVGASSYGCLDMAGNVSEWTSSLFKRYPYYANDGREDPKSALPRVVRGGSWICDDAVFFRCTSRDGLSPDYHDLLVGFRVARDHTP